MNAVDALKTGLDWRYVGICNLGALVWHPPPPPTPGLNISFIVEYENRF